MKASKELGYRKMWRFFWLVPLMGFFNILGYPPCRKWFLSLCGAKVGRDVVLGKIKLINLYAGKFANLKIGDHSFIGDECLFDVVNPITLGNNVTLSERVTVLTHMNVGYQDHPLQKFYPRKDMPVEFKNGCFVGACSTILPGVTVGENALVAAGSVVTKSVAPNTMVAGVPAKEIKKISIYEERK